MKDEHQKKRCRETSSRKLLEAGVEVFAQVGYDCATTKLVAQRAGINESLINRYFEGKAGLLLAIIRQSNECENLEAQISQFSRGDTVEKEILNYFMASLEHFESNNDLMRVLLSRAMVDPEISAEMQKQMHCKGGIQRLIEDLKAFQKRGDIRVDVDVEKAAFCIRAQAFSLGFLFHLVMGVDRKQVAALMSDFAKNYSEGLLR